mmetsp:Transcript_18368/g.45767  ORF Transcript_18368/g.45767 Transcript_18368/m.45767 type:complete len:224 (+) Transcript_18368:504-1175(+)
MTKCDRRPERMIATSKNPMNSGEVITTISLPPLSSSTKSTLKYCRASSASESSVSLALPFFDVGASGLGFDPGSTPVALNCAARRSTRRAASSSTPLSFFSFALSSFSFSVPLSASLSVCLSIPVSASVYISVFCCFFDAPPLLVSSSTFKEDAIAEAASAMASSSSLERSTSLILRATASETSVFTVSVSAPSTFFRSPASRRSNSLPICCPPASSASFQWA